MGAARRSGGACRTTERRVAIGARARARRRPTSRSRSCALEREVATDEVVVLDYGGQYSQLIARRVRECGVFSELLPHHVGVEEVRKRAPKGLILSGGPASVYAPGAPRLDPELLELGIPVLGICYGMQALVLDARRPRRGRRGGRVRPLAADGAPSTGRLLAGHAGRAGVLDVAPRHGVRGAAGLHRAGVARRSRRSPRSRTSSAACTASSSTPRSSTRPTGSRC